MRIMSKLAEELDLDQETTDKLFPVLNKSNEQRGKLGRKRSQIINQMKEELDREFPEAATLKRLIKDFKRSERDIVDARIKRLDDLSKILSDQQIAKLIVLLPTIEKDVRKAIRE